ncbi:hypothetical protein GCM10010525_30280 [Glutamicibacter bergerei]
MGAPQMSQSFRMVTAANCMKTTFQLRSQGSRNPRRNRHNAHYWQGELGLWANCLAGFN